MTSQKIRVLVVDDSAVSRQILSAILNADPSIHVAGEAPDGETAIRLARSLRPDVIVMDIVMPGLNGFLTTQQIMETTPVPIIIVSGIEDPDEVGIIFSAMQAGALLSLRKPAGPGHPNHLKEARDLVWNVKMVSEIRVVKRRPTVVSSPPRPFSHHNRGTGRGAPVRVIAIGVSTGGPIVLQEILSHLPAGFPIPILIVQHIAAGFSEGFADWLSQVSGFPVRLATDRASLKPGVALVAPDGFQMGIDSDHGIHLVDAPPENGLRPSVSFLFRSLAQVCSEKTAAVLLTGMGTDGAAELKHLRDLGAVTVVQDQKSALVYGMPGEAVRLNAAGYILTPAEIADLMVDLSQK
ncbi:chemotaxis-specific protein-glutamate methyltransferase CheB [Methanosphaerula palustris]|uniref:Protein-glutamate methylesterase/protein-glutamine glutaminase n=1 Tax=Methanosphaerula palustris (strain ATCC BAA-1556 / DSM 19958 / E1-9c) TaxID=521011 RepID=B8GHQ8_METPE|nr:chemotaxis-specific protein-glutamate methyltransferase CheB [Methanosphaerula palustris]ACL16663.1 response regulator receiver modulated CheB methylesterase [Methanosphaerula palustris E1-9c]